MFAKWMTMAPRPCLDVSKNQINHDLLLRAGSQNLFTVKVQEQKIV